MRLIKKHVLSFVITLGFASIATAQPGWNWGEQGDVAREKNALYTDDLKLGNYKKAAENLEWLLENTPDLNKSIYINGASIYEGLAEKATDNAIQIKHYEKVLELYDRRIEHFGEREDVLNRKALAAYKYFKQEKSKYPYLMELFTEAFEATGNEFYSSNLTAYMDVIRRYKLTGGDITDEEVFTIYTKVTDVIEYQMENGDNQERMEKVSEYVDKLLTATVDVDCKFVEEKLGPKFRETGDVNLAKKIFGLMLQQKCTDSPLALEAAEAVNSEDPNYAICKFIAQKLAIDGNTSKAMEYYQKAIDLSDDNTKKAEIYLSIARIHSSNGDKVSSRNSARRALSFDPNFKDAYKLIGDLYMNSFADCKGGESKVKDRAVFLAAYEMYQKAGDAESMSRAKEQFPSIEEIFNETYSEGDIVQVDCWINQSVKVERRPAN